MTVLTSLYLGKLVIKKDIDIQPVRDSLYADPVTGEPMFLFHIFYVYSFEIAPEVQVLELIGLEDIPLVP
ncbi:MAG: hypothetical protein ACE5OZ_01025 [Candidatus Heimdallarchaeota archaeon]